MVRPDRVDWIAVERHEHHGGRALHKPVDHVLADEQRIVADAGAGGRRGLEPVRRWLVRDVLELPAGARDLTPDLQNVAAIGEDRRPLGQDDGEPGASREAGQPCQPLGRGRDILAEMLIRPGHQDATDLQTAKAGPERRQTIVKRQHGVTFIKDMCHQHNTAVIMLAVHVWPGFLP